MKTYIKLMSRLGIKRNKENIINFELKIMAAISEGLNNTLMKDNNIDRDSLFQLYEKRHILYTFDDVIDDLYNNFKLNRGNQQPYTGWCFNIISHDCVKCSENAINNDDNLFAIYVDYIMDRTNNTLALTAVRGDGFDIRMDEQVIYIVVNMIPGLNLKTFKSILHHEFLHVYQEYMYKDKNILLSSKNMADNITDEFGLNNNDWIDLINDILYMLSDTKSQARINQEYRYIKDLSFDEIDNLYDSDKVKNQSDMITLIILNTRDINLYDKNIINYIMNLRFKTNIFQSNNDRDIFLIILGYYILEKKFNNFRLKKNNIFDLILFKKLSLNNLDISKSVYNFIHIYMSKYLLKLGNVVSKALEDNGYNKYIFERQL